MISKTIDQILDTGVLYLNGKVMNRKSLLRYLRRIHREVESDYLNGYSSPRILLVLYNESIDDAYCLAMQYGESQIIYEAYMRIADDEYSAQTTLPINYAELLCFIEETIKYTTGITIQLD